MCSHRWLFGIVPSLLLAAFAAGVAQAQTARSGGAGSAELISQLQQLASERTSLQAQNGQLQKQVDDLKGQLKKAQDTLKGARQAADQRAKASADQLAAGSAERDALAQRLKRTQDTMQQLIDRFRVTIEQLREIEADRTETKRTLATRNQELKVCMDRNAGLYKLNEEVLARLDKESVWSRLVESEPFTKIKRVQLENLMDDYKGRADEQHLTEESLKAAVQAMPPPPPAPATAPAPASKPSQAVSAPHGVPTPQGAATPQAAPAAQGPSSQQGATGSPPAQ